MIFILKLFICLLLILNTSILPTKNTFPINTKKSLVSYSDSLYLQNIYVYGNNSIAFDIPKHLKFSYLNVISFISPSGKQLIHTIPQLININSSPVYIMLRKPLNETGIYKITFSGKDEITNNQIDLIGNFTFR